MIDLEIFYLLDLYHCITMMRVEVFIERVCVSSYCVVLKKLTQWKRKIHPWTNRNSSLRLTFCQDINDLGLWRLGACHWKHKWFIHARIYIRKSYLCQLMERAASWMIIARGCQNCIFEYSAKKPTRIKSCPSSWDEIGKRLFTILFALLTGRALSRSKELICPWHSNIG